MPKRYFSSNYMGNCVNSFEYVGNCVNSFDENGCSLIPQFRDVSDFACRDETAKRITENYFRRVTLMPEDLIPAWHELTYWAYVPTSTANKWYVVVAYDETADIHYFFG